MQLFQFLKSSLKTAIYVLFVILTQGWQALGILAISIINNRPWECLFIFMGFLVGRHFFGKTYHAKTLTICTLLTWAVFYFLTSAVPSFSISITIPCIFGVCLAFVLSIIGEYLEKERDYGD